MNNSLSKLSNTCSIESFTVAVLGRDQWKQLMMDRSRYPQTATESWGRNSSVVFVEITLREPWVGREEQKLCLFSFLLLCFVVF